MVRHVLIFRSGQCGEPGYSQLEQHDMACVDMCSVQQQALSWTLLSSTAQLKQQNKQANGTIRITKK